MRYPLICSAIVQWKLLYIIRSEMCVQIFNSHVFVLKTNQFQSSMALYRSLEGIRTKSIGNIYLIGHFVHRLWFNNESIVLLCSQYCACDLFFVHDILPIRFDDNFSCNNLPLYRSILFIPYSRSNILYAFTYKLVASTLRPVSGFVVSSALQQINIIKKKNN